MRSKFNIICMILIIMSFRNSQEEDGQEPPKAPVIEKKTKENPTFSFRDPMTE